MLYPLLLNPVFKEMIWGGNNLAKIFKKETDESKKTGESWEVSCHNAGVSVVRNGSLSGRDLQGICEEYKEEILGTSVYEKYGTYFPLLIKLIDAHDNLSIQVHPNDEYARKNENEAGKTEMWYILEAEPDAKLVYGLKEGTSKEYFEECLNNKDLEKCINIINVKKGDCVFIPSGKVHAILKGIVLIEIQQSSNVTYRVYDWNRVDANGKSRELHVQKALDVISFGAQNNSLTKISPENLSGFTKKALVDCNYFNTAIYEITKDLKITTDKSAFKTFTVIEGSGQVTYAGDASFNLEIKKGDSVLIPANVCEVTVHGTLSILLSEAV